MGVNKAILLGRLGKDPEIKYTPQQLAIGSFSLATGERRKDQSGNWVDHTEWHNIRVFGKQAEMCGNYLKKGREVYIEGRIQTRKWQDRDGKDRWTTEIIANTVQFVGSKGDAAGGGRSAGDSSGAGPSVEEAFASLEPAESIASTGAENGAPASGGGFEDDDIPF